MSTNNDINGNIPQVAEPEEAYQATMSAGVAEMQLPKAPLKVTRAEIEAQTITLEESERRITELIHHHFHPEA